MPGTASIIPARYPMGQHRTLMLIEKSTLEIAYLARLTAGEAFQA
ncbi:hypothetical protein [Halomonas sp. KHS3]|nr:hypothetical protein [Halomonas sp. KHS3]